MDSIGTIKGRLRCSGTRTLVLSLERFVNNMRASYYVGKKYISAALKEHMYMSVYIHQKATFKRYDGSEKPLEKPNFKQEFDRIGPSVMSVSVVDNDTLDSKSSLYIEYPDKFEMSLEQFKYSVYGIYEDEIRRYQKKNITYAIQEILYKPSVKVHRIDFFIEPLFNGHKCQELYNAPTCSNSSTCIYSELKKTWKCMSSKLVTCHYKGEVYSEEDKACTYPEPPCQSFIHEFPVKRKYDGM